MRADKVRDLYEAIDDMRGKFGKHYLHLGAAHAIDSSGRAGAARPPCASRRPSTARRRESTCPCRCCT